MKADLYIKHIKQLVTCKSDADTPLIGSKLNQLEIIDKKSESFEALGTKVILDIPYG